MDNNVFSLDALIDSPVFECCESEKTNRVLCDFYKFADANSTGFIEEELQNLIGDYGNTVFKDGFKQGFCFAIKSIKFLMKI